MPRSFNIAGPCRPERHYMLPAEARLPALLPLVEEELYFVLHAPRQTGKTTAMLAFADRLRGLGYAAVWTTLEQCQGVESVAEAEPLWLAAIDDAARRWLPERLCPPPRATFYGLEHGNRLKSWLSAWCQQLGMVPLVLLLDEADVVSGPALVSLLRQLRAGFSSRGPGHFPVSIGLIGMRELRDHLAQSKDGERVNPGSPFNVKAASITLRNFTEPEVAALYEQHTADTGQRFSPEAIARAYWWSRGQPFLVNALARFAVEQDRERPITAALIDAAKDQLALSRTTHLYSLAERLREPRVAAIVQAVLLGDVPLTVPYDHDDFQYVSDLGLITRDTNGGAEPACPLYREVLARQLSFNIQESLQQPWWPWRTVEGRLDMPALVANFCAWWRQNEAQIARILPLYPEAVPHLAFMGFLQRVVNGGGKVYREYAAGRGAVDLLVEYGPDRIPIELKRIRPNDSPETVRDAGLRQLSASMDTLGARVGWLVLFDQRPGQSWASRQWSEVQRDADHQIHIQGT